MDGPHYESKALGISRDGRTAVGYSLVVTRQHAWRLDIEWAVCTTDPSETTDAEVGTPPLYNEAQVTEELGSPWPNQDSRAYAASDMDPACADAGYDYTKPNVCPDETTCPIEWCNSTVVGTVPIGQVSHAAHWLRPVRVVQDLDEDSAEGPRYSLTPDFGGGTSDMKAKHVSADGRYVVGYGNVRAGTVAFLRDTRSEVLVSGEVDAEPKQLKIIELLPDGVSVGKTLRTSAAEEVSADGTIIVGHGSMRRRGPFPFVTKIKDFSALYNELGEASFEPAGEKVASVLLPAFGGGKWAEAFAVAHDGTVVNGTGTAEDGTLDVTHAVVGGRSDTPKGPVACVWFYVDEGEETGWFIKEVGSLYEGNQDKNSVVLGIAHKPDAPESPVGDYIAVGYSKTTWADEEAFVWTGYAETEAQQAANHPLCDYAETYDSPCYFNRFEKMLTHVGVGEPSGMGSSWVLNRATGVSVAGGDRTDPENPPQVRIVGWGTNPEGGTEAWLVTGWPYYQLHEHEHRRRLRGGE